MALASFEGLQAQIPFRCVSGVRHWAGFGDVSGNVNAKRRHSNSKMDVRIVWSYIQATSTEKIM